MDEVKKIIPQQIEKEEHFPEDPASPQFQTKSMEVQKHPHHVMHKKKWFEYLLEFLMIFLAVFLGFFAENIRERRVDNERLIRQMGNLMGTLKKDIEDLGTDVWYNDDICKGLDSFRFEVNEAIAGRIDANKLYYYHWKYRRGWLNSVPHTSPMSQLQNSGMLRLVKNDTLVYGLCIYYESLSASLNIQRSEAIKRQDILTETCKTMFDLHGFEEIVTRDTIVSWEDARLDNYYAAILQRTPPLTLLSIEPKDLRRLYMDLTLYEIELHRFNEWVRTTINGARRLRNIILTEYNLNTGKSETKYASIGIVGSATAKGWNTSIPMRLNESNRHQWQDTLMLSQGEVKFRVDNKWNINWGNNSFPTGIAMLGGPNIPISIAGTYAITFNDITGDYTFTFVSKNSL